LAALNGCRRAGLKAAPSVMLLADVRTNMRDEQRAQRSEKYEHADDIDLGRGWWAVRRNNVEVNHAVLSFFKSMFILQEGKAL
jgi:hypothetical protein